MTSVIAIADPKLLGQDDVRHLTGDLVPAARASSRPFVGEAEDRLQHLTGVAAFVWHLSSILMMPTAVLFRSCLTSLISRVP